MKKVVLISGGSDGIGKEVARLLSNTYTVIILARNETRLRETVPQLGCEYVVADVSKYEECMNAVSNVVAKFGSIDCLINNAGLWIEGTLVQNDADQIREVIEVNALGTIYLTKAVLPTMQEKQAGQIINVISQSGLYGKKERSVYHASKWAITGFTKSLEAEVSADGIRVSGIYPGKVKTGLFGKAGVEKPMGNALDVVPVAKAIEFIVNADDDVVIPEMGIKLIGG